MRNWKQALAAAAMTAAAGLSAAACGTPVTHGTVQGRHYDPRPYGDEYVSGIYAIQNRCSPDWLTSTSPKNSGLYSWNFWSCPQPPEWELAVSQDHQPAKWVKVTQYVYSRHPDGSYWQQ